MTQPAVETQKAGTGSYTSGAAAPGAQKVAATGLQAQAILLPGGWLPQLLPFSLVLAFWLVNLLVISPSGNFPLNDDWIYSESVAHLLRTGQFHLLGCSPACVLHVAIGAAASLVAGYSHEHLRLLTDCFALATSFVLYLTLLIMGMDRRLAALSSLVLLANPLFVNLSFSFMTDVPALLFSGIYCLCTILAVRKNSPLMAACAGVALCAAILVRQTFAVFVAPSLLLVLFSKQLTKRSAATGTVLDNGTDAAPKGGLCSKLAAPSGCTTLVIFVTSVLAPIAVALLAERMMLRGNDFAAVYDWYKAQFGNVVHQLVFSPAVGAAGMLERTFKVFCYFGLFCVPLMPFLLRQLGTELKTRNASSRWAVALAALVSVPSFIHTVVLSHQLMPFSNNLWRIPMVGPINLMGICVAGLKTRQRLYITIAASVLALILLAAAIRCLFTGLNRLRTEKDSLFITAFAATAIGLVALQTGVLDYDRYYLTALPALLMVLTLCPLKANGRAVWAAAGILCLALAAYSTLATQDYLSWNRARFQAIAELENKGVKPTDIDGGPEYNYLVNPELIKACNLSLGTYAIIHRGARPMCDWRWWSVSGEKYIISFNTIPGYDLVARHKFFGGLTLSQREIFTLKQR